MYIVYISSLDLYKESIVFVLLLKNIVNFVY